MSGLPGDTREGFFKTVETVIGIRPDMVRIHPVLVFSGTELAELYRKGDYRPLTVTEAIDWCRQAVTRFDYAGIPVIRIGLQPTEDIERDLIDGPYHPAFRSLVEGEIFFAMASKLLTTVPNLSGDAIFHVSPAESSYFRGLNNRNLKRLRLLTAPVKMLLKEDLNQPKGSLKLEVGNLLFKADRFSGTGRLNIL